MALNRVQLLHIINDKCGGDWKNKLHSFLTDNHPPVFLHQYMVPGEKGIDFIDYEILDESDQGTGVYMTGFMLYGGLSVGNRSSVSRSGIFKNESKAEYYLDVSDIMGVGYIADEVPDYVITPLKVTILPAAGNIEIEDGGTFESKIKADTNDGIISVEVNSDNSDIIGHIKLVQDVDNPYGSTALKTSVENLGITVTYVAVDQEWTIDWGSAITAEIVAEDDISLYFRVVTEIGMYFGSLYGSMIGESKGSTLKYSLEQLPAE